MRCEQVNGKQVSGRQAGVWEGPEEKAKPETEDCDCGIRNSQNKPKTKGG